MPARRSPNDPRPQGLPSSSTSPPLPTYTITTFPSAPPTNPSHRDEEQDVQPEYDASAEPSFSSFSSQDSLSQLFDFGATPPLASPAEPSSDEPSRPVDLPTRRRRSRKAESPDRIKRPPNCFMLFRSAYEAQIKVFYPGGLKRPETRRVSGQASKVWNSMSDDEKRPWREQADAKKKEHESIYPDYVYRPRQKKGGKKKASSKEEKEVAVAQSTSWGASREPEGHSVGGPPKSRRRRARPSPMASAAAGRSTFPGPMPPLAPNPPSPAPPSTLCWDSGVKFALDNLGQRAPIDGAEYGDLNNGQQNFYGAGPSRSDGAANVGDFNPYRGWVNRGSLPAPNHYLQQNYVNQPQSSSMASFDLSRSSSYSDFQGYSTTAGAGPSVIDPLLALDPQIAVQSTSNIDVFCSELLNFPPVVMQPTTYQDMQYPSFNVDTGANDAANWITPPVSSASPIAGLPYQVSVSAEVQATNNYFDTVFGNFDAIAASHNNIVRTPGPSSSGENTEGELEDYSDIFSGCF